LVLVGDFNVNFSKTAHGHELRLQEKLMSALVQFDCSVMNKDFTRVTPTTETMVDLIITNKRDLVEHFKTADTEYPITT
jgi:endonuclease/exonuclease/phosphatase family metal-dependent hydrolase